MIDQELKQAMAKALPELIIPCDCGCSNCINLKWSDTQCLITEREWPEVMRLAEIQLDKDTGGKSVKCLIRSYWVSLMQIMNPDIILWHNGTYLGTWGNAIKVGKATWQQRAEEFLKTIEKRVQ